jgi:preprotein translocase subunit SecB
MLKGLKMTKATSVLRGDAPPLEVTQASVQLDGYYIKELHCAVRGDLAERAKFALGTGLHLQQSEVMLCPALTTKLLVETGQNTKDPSKFRVMLQIVSNEETEETPYTFDLQLVGYFSLNDLKPFIGMDVWVYRNAVMLLYSAAREVIASVTGRGPFPALILPTLAFDVTESARAAIRAEEEAEQIRTSAKKRPRQLPPAAKKLSKKKARKKGAKK